VGQNTSIAWTDHTFNPWTMCTPIGPGCDNCYASAWAKRTGRGEYRQGVPRVRTTDANWREPLKWDKKAASAGVRRRVFCASLADVFDNEVPSEWRYDLWKLIEATPNLSWLLVTKRVGNVYNMVPWAWQARFPDNVRLLITVCNQEEADRDIPKLLALPCKNGVSYEPALGAVDWRPFLAKCYHDADKPKRGVEWVICGGESTQGAGKARPFDIAWARSTVAQCKAAGVRVFMKQIGSRPVAGSPDADYLLPRAMGTEGPPQDRAGADPAEWPSDLRIQEFPA
jgi:protein gp37